MIVREVLRCTDEEVELIIKKFDFFNDYKDTLEFLLSEYVFGNPEYTGGYDRVKSTIEALIIAKFVYEKQQFRTMEEQKQRNGKLKH